jgi:hypothetical protein
MYMLGVHRVISDILVDTMVVVKDITVLLHCVLVAVVEVLRTYE